MTVDDAIEKLEQLDSRIGTYPTHQVSIGVIRAWIRGLIEIYIADLKADKDAVE